MDRATIKAVYKRRAAERAAHQPGGALQRTDAEEEQPAPAPQADAFGKMVAYTLLNEAIESEAGNAMFDAAAVAGVYAKRRKARAAWPAGSGEEE